VQARGDVGAQARTRSHRPQGFRHWAVDLRGSGAERRDWMRAHAQFGDQNIQRGLQRCGFSGATSGPEIPPPARPQRDTDDRGRRDNTDRQRDYQCHSDDARARQQRQPSSRLRQNAECFEPVA
jgi:hypothetical protein